MRVTGERIVTPAGGFNASWQRHSACYACCTRFLDAGTVLDLGCGTGHAHDLLSPRRVVGLDRDRASLEGRDGLRVVGDMRALPFAARSFPSVLCIHAIEHVPDPERLLAESVRVLAPGGSAIFVTPNRLTFALPDEIIDPYHYREYDPEELKELCSYHFRHVEMFALLGSARYMEFFHAERRELRALLRKDPLRLRRALPRRVRQVLYDWKLTRSRLDEGSPASEFTILDFELQTEGLDGGLDLMAVCTT